MYKAPALDGSWRLGEHLPSFLEASVVATRDGGRYSAHRLLSENVSTKVAEIRKYSRVMSLRVEKKVTFSRLA